jgi:hypothetical protein
MHLPAALLFMISAASVHTLPYTAPSLAPNIFQLLLLLLQIGNPKKLDAIFVPIGGGGLIAGIAAYVKALHPHIKVCSTEDSCIAIGCKRSVIGC